MTSIGCVGFSVATFYFVSSGLSDESNLNASCDNLLMHLTLQDMIHYFSKVVKEDMNIIYLWRRLSHRSHFPIPLSLLFEFVQNFISASVKYPLCFTV